jgi:phosphatidylglycerol lysyltransferase
LAAGGMMRDGGPLGLLAELARQYLPVPLPNLYRRVFAERDSIEALIFGYSGPLFWLVALAGVWSVLVGRHHGSDSGHNDRTAARRLLHQGGESLSWMALWEPNRYWFSTDGRGAVAYQQHGTVALTLAGPFGAAESRGPTAKGFIDYCGSRALAPAFYSCDGTLWPMLRDRGFQRVPVAQETRLSVRELDFKGKEWQNVRTARNRAAKLGVTAVWGTYHGLPSTLRARLSEVSEEWAAAKSIPEMGFTLGGIDELMDEEVLCCLAVDTDGNVHGVTSWLPVYDGGKLVSRTLDVMRRGAEGFPGVMEFLIAAAVVELRETVEVISLSGSPLASLPDGDTTLDQVPAENLLRILDVVGHALEPVYGFRSLAAFKSRFQPEYRTLYLYYQDPLQLPAIGRALTRAYLPGLSLRQGARLVRELVG